MSPQRVRSRSAIPPKRNGPRVIERTPYHEGPVRYSYRLTESGDALIGVLDALLEWGKQYAVAPDDPDRQRRYRPLSELKAKESR